MSSWQNHSSDERIAMIQTVGQDHNIEDKCRRERLVGDGSSQSFVQYILWEMASFQGGNFVE